MIETLKLKEKSRIKKLEKIAETRMAVHTHTHTHTLYCHLENKKEKLNNIKIMDRTMLNKKIGIGLSFCVFCEKLSHKHKRAGPLKYGRNKKLKYRLIGKTKMIT